jgi:FkbM family methyltransferase
MDSSSAAKEWLTQIGDAVRPGLRVGVYSFTHPTQVRLSGVKVNLQGLPMPPEVRRGLYSGRYESQEAAVLKATLRADDTCLELGGGLGILTTIASARTRQVTVYEANPDLLPIISRTLESNHASAKIHNAAVATEDGKVDFYISASFWESSMTPNPAFVKREIEAISFDRLLREISPTYLICDIEGAELDILTAGSLPASLRAICLETHPDATGIEGVGRLISHLLADGFALDLEQSRGGVAFFYRPEPTAGSSSG